MSSPDRLEQTTRLLEHPVPDSLWEALEPLVREGRAGFVPALPLEV
jgi:hypothetical protein